MSSVAGSMVDKVTHAADAKVVSPDLTSGGLVQKLRFERGFAIDT